MKTVVIIISTFLTFSSLSAQNFNSWQGGTPGSETDWNTAQNWSKNQVPDWTDDVLIPNVTTSGNFYPIINSEVEEVQSLTICSNAKLTIAQSGSLKIDGGQTWNYGITNGGILLNQGTLQIDNTALVAIYQQPETNGQLIDTGNTLINAPMDDTALDWLSFEQ